MSTSMSLSRSTSLSTDGHPAALVKALEALFSPRVLLLCGALCAFAALAGCGDDSAAMLHEDGGPSLDFTLGPRTFHAGSATARTSGGVLGFYFTDQPDACSAIVNVPVGKSAIFTLRVSPQIDGTASATVIAPTAAPQPGQANGNILWQTGGNKDASLDTVSGSVKWVAKNDGTWLITSLDVGFTGAAERIGIAGYQLGNCF